MESYKHCVITHYNIRHRSHTHVSFIVYFVVSQLLCVSYFTIMQRTKEFK